MATIAIRDVCWDPPTLRLAITIPDLFWSFMRRRRERRLMARLARLSPHLIRDIGFDPDQVYDAVAGTWGEVDPGRPRVR